MDNRRPTGWRAAATLFLALLAGSPAAAQELPGVWYLNALGTSDDLPRLSVGGSSQAPPATADEVCLAWRWKEPSPDVDLYPGSAAGELVGVEQTWTIRGDGTTIAPQGCAAATPPFPELAIGPGRGLWFLRSSQGQSDSGQSDAWAQLLHAVEAAYRQSAPGGELPLAEMRIGTFGACDVVSLPVGRDTELDRWLPVELPAHARASSAGGAAHVDSGDAEAAEAALPVRLRRFLWWVDDTASGSCVADGASGNLDLFPVTADEGESFLLRVEGVSWRGLRYAELDPDDWSPRVRSIVALEPAPEPAVLPTPEQRDRLLRPVSFDLCEIEGIAGLCRSNETARRRLFTAVTLTGADVPWSQSRIAAAQTSCRSLLDQHSNRDACTAETWWSEKLVGELRAGFTGDWVVSDTPRLVETWNQGKVAWQIDEPGQLISEPHLELHLIDGRRVVITTEVFRAAADGRAELERWIVPGMAAAALLLSILALLRARPRRRPRGAAPSAKQIERMIESTVERRLKSAVAGGGGGAAAELDGAVRSLEARAAELHTELEDHARNLVGGAKPAESPTAAQAPAEVPPPSIPSIPSTASISASGLDSLRRDVETLDGDERQRIFHALEAVTQLGCWIELLWPALLEAAGAPLDAIPDTLPGPAAEEWRGARRVLEDFTKRDVPAVRTLLRSLTNGTKAAAAGETSFFESSGLLDMELALPERLKQYLEPFDHPGRLGEITLALQYLVEAYPIEQLEGERRTHLRRELAEAVRSVRLAEDFHHLVARIAAGVGLLYRPVPYYKGRLDQSDYAFVRQQVSPISLTERVGFAAATDPALIVRLERPFFVQSFNNVYYAGHAHVAHG